MLVLQRKVGEQVRIGTDIVVTVLRTACGKVSLGIQAPPDYRIRRSELLSLLGSGTTASGVPPV
ncbi:MAG: carbon storage regulator [Planctomycetaceae bacterium]